MGHFGSTRRPENMKSLDLLFLTSVACSPVEIINYSDEEAGHGHMMEGVPGIEVEGSYYWKAPEGDNIKLVYTAGEEGYVATGDHLPVSPDAPEAPMMVLPVMPELTPEVAEARSSFMQVFDEIKMKNVEEAAEVVEDAVVMEKRDADADPLLVQYQKTLPLYRTYAPAYPAYYPGLSYYPGLVTNPSLGSSFTGLTGVVQPAPSMESMEPSGGVLPSETLE